MRQPYFGIQRIETGGCRGYRPEAHYLDPVEAALANFEGAVEQGPEAGIGFVSMFSGIGVPDFAWLRRGTFRSLGHAEIDPFACAVLEARFPHSPNFGDVSRKDWKSWRKRSLHGLPLPVLVGGSPCQPYSIAGTRLGLDDPRGNLALVFVRAARDLDAALTVYENVPHLATSNAGKDFAMFLDEWRATGRAFAWGVLDSRFFGVGQRRRRIFGCAARDWSDAAAVVLAPRGDDRHLGCPLYDDRSPESVLLSLVKERRFRKGSVGIKVTSVSAELGRPEKTVWGNAGVMTADGTVFTVDKAEGAVEWRGIPLPFDTREVFDYSRCGGDPHRLILSRRAAEGLAKRAVTKRLKMPHRLAEAIAAQLAGAGSEWLGGGYVPAVTGTLTTGAGLARVSAASNCLEMVVGLGDALVRRFSPEEAEELQGLPRGWTRIAWQEGNAGSKGDGFCDDNPRYKAVGNAMAIPVLDYIGAGIELVL